MTDANGLSHDMPIDDAAVAKFELKPLGRRYAVLGLTNSRVEETLTFLDDERYFSSLCDNPNITGVVTNPALAARVVENCPSISTYVHNDPRWAFFSFQNHETQRLRTIWPSQIHPDAVIHPAATVADNNVVIGARTTIAAGAVVKADVEIGEDCVIEPNVVVGGEGFEYKRTSRGLLPVIHDGVVRVGNRVELGCGTCVDKGFAGRPTVLEDDCKTDNLVHIGHCACIGEGALLTAGTIIAGSVTVGKRVFLGINSSIAPNVTIGDDALISMGAVVSRDVPARGQVTGNLAVPHKEFLRRFKAVGVLAGKPS
ncbi:MAG: hypothetical protein DI591_11920 [Citromicrobium sp.]|nr:MAG: hypothetical protein DI591_11920 [Citromicrobium sp.]